MGEGPLNCYLTVINGINGDMGFIAGGCHDTDSGGGKF